MIPGRLSALPLCALIATCLALPACGSDSDTLSPVPLPSGNPAADASPPLDQREPVAPAALLLDYRGLINTVADASESTLATYGKASFLAIADGQSTWMLDEPIAYIYRYPDDYPVEERRGQEFLVLQAYREQSVSGAEMHADSAQVYLPRTELELLAGQQQGAVRAAQGLRANLRRYSGYYRSDQVTFIRDCYRAISDDDLAASELVVDARENKTFSAGETVLASANIGLRTDYVSLEASLGEVLEAYDGMFCSCTRNTERIPCDEWLAQIHEDPGALTCELPEDFLDPKDPSHAVFRFKGPINATGGTMKNGTAVFDVALAAQPVSLEYSAYAYRSKLTSGTYAGKETIALTALGGVDQSSETRYTYNALIATYFVDALTAAKSSGQNGFSLDMQHLFSVVLYAVDQIDDPGNRLQKICPRAVNKQTNTSNWLCHEANESFAVGEQLEIASNLLLTDDPEEMGTAGLPDGGCMCLRNDESIDCSEFPAPADGG